MVTRSRAWEGRGISVAPEVPREPEIQMRPESEITTCEVWEPLDHPTDIALITFAEIVTAHASQEVTETSRISTAPSQTTFPSHTVSQTSRSHKNNNKKE